MSSMVPCAPSNKMASPSASAWFSRTAVSHTNGAIFSAAAAYSEYILSASSGSELNRAWAIMFFSRTAFSMCFFKSWRSSRSAARRPQHSAGDQLQDEFLAVDNDRVAGIMAAGIARDNGKILRQHVDNLSLALVAPLGANNDRGLASFQCQLRHRDLQRTTAQRVCMKTRGPTRLAAAIL